MARVCDLVGMSAGPVESSEVSVKRVSPCQTKRGLVHRCNPWVVDCSASPMHQGVCLFDWWRAQYQLLQLCEDGTLCMGLQIVRHLLEDGHTVTVVTGASASFLTNALPPELYGEDRFGFRKATLDVGAKQLDAFTVDMKGGYAEALFPL